MSYFSFKIIHQSTKSKARVGQITTPHGVIDTPNFVAVGTNGTLKAVDNQMLEQMEQQLMFCNTYHLLVHPGPNIIKAAGGIHKFINRNQPIITDSGGFQVFSLAYGTVKDELKSKGTKSQQNSVTKITEDGVTFRSYRDGAKILLTPEISIQVQKDLGADIIIPFDELPPYHIDEKSLKKSVDRTHRWEKRSLEEHLKNPQQQAIYAVIHGGISKDLRKLSCQTLTALPFDGFAIGGSVGKNHTEMVEMLTYTIPQLPENKPNHLLGIGDLPAIAEIIPLGIDTFDSSHPTKCARHGHLFSSQGTIKISQVQHTMNFGPIDPICSCYTCKNYTISYVHHLFKAHEPIALTLATIHNIAFMVQIMKQYRQDILDGKI